MNEQSIQTELSDLIGQMVTQSTTNNATPEPTSVTPEPTPVVPAVPAPNVAAPAVTPDSGVDVSTAPQIDVDAVIDSWDSATTAVPNQTTATAAPVAVPQVPTPSPTSALEISELAKVLHKESFISKDEALRELESKVRQAELISSLPEPVQKAMEIAALGGNYLEYLGVSQTDWMKEDPITLYENYVEDQYVGADGRVDIEKVDKLLDKMDDDEKELRGRELQRQYVNYQAQQKARYENQARSDRYNFEQSVRKAVDAMDNIANFKLSPSHKEELYSYVVSGQDLKQPDVNQRLVNAFITKNWGKIDNFRKQQIKNSTLKKLIDEVTVPVITPVGQAPTPQGNSGFSLDDYVKQMAINRR
jgi:hypothetical protein